MRNYKIIYPILYAFIFINVHRRSEKMSEENLDSKNLERRINLIAGLKNNVEIVKKNLEAGAYYFIFIVLMYI